MRANEAGDWFPLCDPFLYYYTKFTDDDGLTVKQSGDESKKMRKKGKKTREKKERR